MALKDFINVCSLLMQFVLGAEFIFMVIRLGSYRATESQVKFGVKIVWAGLFCVGVASAPWIQASGEAIAAVTALGFILAGFILYCIRTKVDWIKK